MQIFENFTGLVAPLDRSNIDTDTIIPKQYLKSIKRTGFGVNLFDEWRYLADEAGSEQSLPRRENPNFFLNQSRYRGAEILLARENFGCGSSREHAVWAFLDYGMKTVIAPSFADIFYSNAFKNGLLLLTFDTKIIDKLFQAVAKTVGYTLSIDLQSLMVVSPEGEKLTFELAADLQDRLLQGLDDIVMTLAHSSEIRAYEAQRRQRAPWLFTDSPEL